jgi:hypothetical protein
MVKINITTDFDAIDGADDVINLRGVIIEANPNDTI